MISSKGAIVESPGPFPPLIYGQQKSGCDLAKEVPFLVNAVDLNPLLSVEMPCPSFRRKTESSLFRSLLDPGFRRRDD